jgi:sorting nexin-8
MSLFNDDDLAPRRAPSSSLFDDDPKPTSRTGDSLFADDLQGDDSPWGFPTPKKAGRGNLVKSLLPASDVPDSYIDTYDALLESGDGAGNAISLQEVKKLLGTSGLPSDTQSKILETVSPPGQETAGLGREEFNVLFALIALAQEGDDITLDSVDERKRSKWALMLPKSFN